MLADPFDVSSIYKVIDKDDNPKNYTINKGPFNLFAVIDGHGIYGDGIAYVIKKHLLDVVYRNRNIMVKRRYSKGLKEVFVKLEELLGSDLFQKEMRDYLKLAESVNGSNYLPEENPDPRPRSQNPEWASGAAMTIVIIASD